MKNKKLKCDKSKEPPCHLEPSKELCKDCPLNRKINVFKYIDNFWYWLNDYSNDDYKIIKAKKEIIEIIIVLCFGMGSFLIMYIFVVGQHLENVSGTGLIWVGFILIFIVWAFVILHINKVSKCQTPHVPTKNYQQQHE